MKKIKILSFFVLVLMFGIYPLDAFALFTSECTGGSITYAGGKVIHTFTTGGTLDCTSAGGGNIEVLVVAGGGGGGSNEGGGGGAGGYKYDSDYAITAQTYSITVGAGGAGASVGSTNGSDGSDSIFDSITATGGGGGGGALSGVPASNGGSGGGGAYLGANSGVGGTGDGSGEGSNGGDGGVSGAGGGGGGASTAGTNGSSPSTGGAGGDGTTNSITGSAIVYAGGGGGAYDGAGGSGGGGAGVPSGTPNAGVANTGGGGGGSGAGSSHTGGSGGSGVVIVSYATSTLINGYGTTNRIAKFSATTTITNSLLSDDGTNITLTSGNFLMPIGSLLDSLSSGSLNFGTTYATTMTFGSSSQKMIINSKVGIATSTPSSTLDVNGSIFANFIKVLANDFGLDTLTAGILYIGSTTANSINIGHANATTTISGPLKITNINTISNCNSTTTPSTCGLAVSGSVAMPTGGSTIVVNTSAVTANSQIFVTEDSSLGTRLGITCNTTTGRIYSINARTAGTSFTIKSSANPATNKACLSYFIVN